MSTDAGPMYEWQDIPWRTVERKVFKLQRRIYRATHRGETRTVHRLQRLLKRSWYARLLATRRVTQDNRGKKTAGVDGVKNVAPPQRLKLAQRLTHPLKAKPIRRVWIPKPGTEEKRPLGILVMHDRAKQALIKLALEPEWEAKFEPNSYGFRPGRSCHDAIEAIFTSIGQKAKAVLEADIEKCFECVNHQALLTKLHTYPAQRREIKAWLKAGVMEGQEVFPTEAGTCQGAVLSPLLAGVALQGLETVVKNCFPTTRAQRGVTVVTYADDFVVLHESPAVLEKVKGVVAAWLADMGLRLKPTKTRVTHTLTTGFEFLGFHIKHYPVGRARAGKRGFKTLIKPSPKNQKAHLKQLGEIIRSHKGAAQSGLIKRLTPVIRGWSTYYSTVVAKATFQRLDHLLYEQLRRWAQHRHPQKSRRWIANKYWHVNTDGWIFRTEDGITLRKHADTPIHRHIKVQGHKSPYDGEWSYWAARMGRHPAISPTRATLLRRQRGKCLWCGLYFRLEEEVVECDHILPTHKGGEKRVANLQLLHGHCHDEKTAADRRGATDNGPAIEEPDDGTTVTSGSVAEPEEETPLA